MLAGGDRVSRQFGDKLWLLAQIIAQNAVDQPAKASFRQFPGRYDRLVYNRMGGIGPGFQAIKGDQQQGAHLGRLERAGQQAAEEEIASPVTPQAAIDQILDRRTHCCVDPGEQAVGQTLPGKYGGIDTGRLQESEAKRIRR